MLPEAPLVLHGAQVDLRRRLVQREDGSTTSLTAREVDLLAWLARNPGRTITREELLVEVWGYSPDMVTRTVDNTIRRLRTKIEDKPREPRHVLTVFGEGYRFAPLESRSAPLPEGRVALVRTRVEGLEELTERDPELAAASLAVLDDVLAQAVDEARGVLVRAGAESLVAFGEPHGAVAFALGLQDDLGAADWPEALRHTQAGGPPRPDAPGPWGGLRVAVAVSLGPGSALGDAYEGPVQDEVTGLVDAAHGGQILLGPAAWSAIESFRELGATSTPLGTLVLWPEGPSLAVVGVLPDTLAARRFPPPRTPDARQTNLDDDVNSFVGRRQVLQTLRGWFARGARYVTVLGPAGAGKTRVARRFGLSRVDDLSSHGGGVWFVDLSDDTREEEVVAAVAAALSVPLDPDRPVEEDREQVGRALAARGRMLLILDNAEQIVPVVQACALAWGQAAPECAFLVTSRHVLDLPDEHVLDLPPLDESESLALFVDRARAVRLDLELGDEDLDAIAEIAERLDHNPLALELAAVRVRVLPPTRLAERLNRRFSTLGRGPRDGPARHATLDVAIEWSWGLLEPWGQAAFAQLGAFRGGFDLEAARAVVELPDGAPPLSEVLVALRDRSLLRGAEPVGLAGETRFRLLHSLQEWALRRLAEREDAGAIHARHRAWAVARGGELVGRIDGPHGASAVRRLTLELGNLRAAHRDALHAADVESACALAVILDTVLAPRGPYEDHLHLLDETLDAAADASTEARMPVLLARARAHDVRGDVSAARSNLGVAAREARRSGRAALIASSLLAWGEWAAARRWPDELERVLRAAGGLDLDAVDPAVHARLDALRAQRHAALGEIDEALRLGRAAVQALSALSARRHEAALRVEVAGWAAWRGQVDVARDLHRGALRVARELGDLRLEAGVLARLGALYHEVGRIELAAEHLVLAEEQLRRVGDRRQVGVTQGHLGVLRAEQGASEDALALLDAALGVLDETDDRRLEGHFLGWRAAVLARMGRQDEAIALFARALDRLEEAGDDRERGRVIARSVPLLRALSRGSEAERALKRARDLALRLQDPGGQEAVALLAGEQDTRPSPVHLEARWVAGRAGIDHI